MRHRPGTPGPAVALFREFGCLARRVGPSHRETQNTGLHPHIPTQLILVTFLPFFSAFQDRLLALAGGLRGLRGHGDSCSASPKELPNLSYECQYTTVVPPRYRHRLLHPHRPVPRPERREGVYRVSVCAACPLSGPFLSKRPNRTHNTPPRGRVRRRLFATLKNTRA